MLSVIIRAFEEQQQQAASAEQSLAPFAGAPVDTSSGQSQPDSRQGAAFHFDTVVNDILQDGQFSNMVPSPTFAEGGTSSELANIMLSSAWTATTYHGPKTLTAERHSQTDTEQNSGSA
jgi:hypothetical protein